MFAQTLSTDHAQTLKGAVQAAVSALASGEVVALPTETVYGLAADATNPAALAKIFAVKERPEFDPLILHLAHHKDLSGVAIVPPEIEADFRKLIENFWPGPLTIVLPKHPGVPDLATAGLPTVAVRRSANVVFAKVVKEFGRPLAAPSANLFGRLSPTSAAAVQEQLGERISLILDGGACACGLESTIIRIVPSGKTRPNLEILRPGAVPPELLKPFGKPVLIENSPSSTPEAPGQLEGHYAPRTPLRLLEDPVDFQPEEGRRYALLSLRGEEEDGYLFLADFVETAVLSPRAGKLPEAAVRFFHLLRLLDQSGVDEILVEPIPARGLGLAMRDRLRRAAAKASE